MKVGVPPDAEVEGTTVSPALGRLKMRPVHVSSSSDSTATTPPRLTMPGVGLMGWGTGVAEVQGAMGVEGPATTVAALHLTSRSTNFFFLSLLKPISTRKKKVNTENHEDK